ncbi:MAG: TPM domain-containing protein, partial [Candidatus Binatia bacterium]
DYAGGIVAGIDAVQKVIRKEPLPQSARRKTQQEPNLNFFAMFAITFVVLGLMAFTSTANRRRSGVWGTRGQRGPIIWGGPGGWGGGGFGGGGSDGGGFSGGGGGFGGGGASDSW